MATVRHATSSSGLKKFQADGFLLVWVYNTDLNNFRNIPSNVSELAWGTWRTHTNRDINPLSSHMEFKLGYKPKTCPEEKVNETELYVPNGGLHIGGFERWDYVLESFISIVSTFFKKNIFKGFRQVKTDMLTR